MLGFFHAKARPLAGNHALWIGLFLLAFCPWLVVFPASWVRLRDSGMPWSKRVWTLVLTTIILCFLYYPAFFGGAPKLLHYLSHDEGTLITTITGKSDWAGRFYFCAPRIDLAAISAPTYGVGGG